MDRCKSAAQLFLRDLPIIPLLLALNLCLALQYLPNHLRALFADGAGTAVVNGGLACSPILMNPRIWYLGYRGDVDERTFAVGEF
ncbi:hypothetical protein QBC35DRAFT_67645 [Podospora australis]|uniref:Uncharacterized protein n=1 Tax=Podospora australis TaxID=1536484 RepID=A0AAN6WPP7_9PEZI|nr:hypothetical protein QBC35DRAFT_67645 [Podospora australis]